MRAYIERHGKPVAFYSDKYSVLRSTNAGKTGSSVTHFGRAMLMDVTDQIGVLRNGIFGGASCRRIVR
jgi:hypothetical protein